MKPPQPCDGYANGLQIMLFILSPALNFVGITFFNLLPDNK